MTQRANHFSSIVRQVGGIPLLFEVIPPRRDVPAERVRKWRDRIVAAVEGLPVVAVNIPEVREESREGERTYSFVRRIKPREFGKQVRDAFHNSIDLVINRVVVYRSIDKQKKWLENSYRDWGVRNLILVGGESRRIRYPGPTVSAMAKLITEEINAHLPEDERWFCGGIVIPSRRSSDPHRDEPQRLVAKARTGLEFFTSQVIYEPDKTCRLLADYSKLCQQHNELPKRIFISFAPVQERRHVEFMRWLGVDIPPGIEGELLSESTAVGARSLTICQRVFCEIRDFNERLPLPIPLGVNVSPLMRSNFDLGVTLAGQLADLVRT